MSEQPVALLPAPPAPFTEPEMVLMTTVRMDWKGDEIEAMFLDGKLCRVINVTTGQWYVVPEEDSDVE